MNKVVTSAGLLALGAASLYGYDPDMTRAKTGRPWTVSATVRGFYDDNPTTTPDKTPVGINPVSGRTVFNEPEGSFGVEVSPSVHVNLPLEQTFIRAGYIYSLRYYDERDPHDIDQSHEFNALLRHAFSPRHDISLAESLVITEEPTVLESQGIISSPTRTDGDTLRNRAAVDYNLGLTRTLALGLGYANTFYDYDQEGVGSRSALLDRMEHLFRADGRYEFNPSLVGLLGYQFGMISYNGDDAIFAGSRDEGDVRDAHSHYVYVGADHDFSQRLRGSIRVGAQYTDYQEVSDSEVNPYLDASLTYLYRQDSSIQAGVKHARNATDSVNPDPADPSDITLDQESTAGYVQLIHRIIPNLTGSLFGQVQYSTWQGGDLDGDNEVIYLLGANLEYRINRYLSAEIGYNFDLLDSDMDDDSRYDVRGYDRSRYYVGLRATY